MKYLFQGIVIIAFINLILWLRSDCFDCPPIYASSIREWANYTPSQSPQDSIAKECEEIIKLLNDTLFNDEKKFILKRLEDAAEQGKLNEYLAYFSEIKPVANNDKNAIFWLYYKIDEAEPDYQKTFMGMYSSFLSIGQSTPSESKSYITWGDISKVILSDKSLKALGYEQWFEPQNYWPRFYALYRKPLTEIPSEMQQFLIKRLAREFTFQNKYRLDGLRQIEDTRIKFELDSSQVFQYSEN